MRANLCAAVGQLSELIVLAVAILLAGILFALASTLGVTAVLGVSRTRRRMARATGRLALLERQLRSRLRATTAELEAAHATLQRFGRGR